MACDFKKVKGLVLEKGTCQNNSATPPLRGCSSAQLCRGGGGDPGSGMLPASFCKFQGYCILDLTVCSESVWARDSFPWPLAWETD